MNVIFKTRQYFTIYYLLTHSFRPACLLLKEYFALSSVTPLHVYATLIDFENMKNISTQMSLY